MTKLFLNFFNECSDNKFPMHYITMSFKGESCVVDSLRTKTDGNLNSIRNECRGKPYAQPRTKTAIERMFYGRT